RTLEHMGMVRQGWGRGGGGRRKFYEAETDFWQNISNVLSGREVRDVDRALTGMNGNVERLSKTMPTMTEDDRKLAELYVERIEQMQVLFRFAQLMITSILSKAGEADFHDVSRVEIE